MSPRLTFTFASLYILDNFQCCLLPTRKCKKFKGRLLLRKGMILVKIIYETEKADNVIHKENVKENTK